MKLAVAALVRNEIDIIGAFLQHLDALFDYALLMDHGSIDGTDRADRRRLRAPGRLDDVAYRCRGLPPERVQQLRARPSDAKHRCRCRHACSTPTSSSTCRTAPAWSPRSARLTDPDSVGSLSWLNAVPARLDTRTISPGEAIWLPAAARRLGKAAIPRVFYARHGDEARLGLGNHALYYEPERVVPSVPVGQIVHLPIRSYSQIKSKVLAGVFAVMMQAPPQPLQCWHWYDILYRIGAGTLHDADRDRHGRALQREGQPDLHPRRMGGPACERLPPGAARGRIRAGRCPPSRRNCRSTRRNSSRPSCAGSSSRICKPTSWCCKATGFVSFRKSKRHDPPLHRHPHPRLHPGSRWSLRHRFQLALLGADVIKVERREGEDMRRTPLSREWADRGMAPSWLAINGNKRSLTLDLQKPAAIEIIQRLAAKADVVMENFRGGVMDRLGIGYAALSEINPRLIYCAISGFGQTGPYSNEAGYDGKIQALSGIMSITGHAEMGPTRAGFAVCDVLSGMTAAFAVSSALFQRTHTGKGQFIDVSMLEASLAFLSTQVADFTVAGHRQEQFGNQAISRKVTANLFRAKDSFLLLAVNDEKQYRALMTHARPRRRAGRSALRRLVPAQGERSGVAGDHRGRRWQRQDAKAWEKQLNDAGAPCASIWRSRKSSTIRRSSRARSMQSVRDAVWAGAADGLGLSDGAWRRAAGHRAAGTWRAYR